jgi:catechol 2,3-dioxygenase-like lactoylglutathione lyase family enzyme
MQVLQGRENGAIGAIPKRINYERAVLLRGGQDMNEDFPAPREGMLLTHLLIVEDVDRSRAFYRDVLGAEVVLERNPCVMKFHNGWLIINVGGGPTDDKPTVTMAPPRDPDTVGCALNIRVADIQATYNEWRSRGAEFLTTPIDWGAEIRCYLRDPDGHLIEVGQTTGLLSR